MRYGYPAGVKATLNPYNKDRLAQPVEPVDAGLKVLKG